MEASTAVAAWTLRLFLAHSHFSIPTQAGSHEAIFQDRVDTLDQAPKSAIFITSWRGEVERID